MSSESSPDASAASPPDSRWWYWIGAVPVVTGFWLVTAAWILAVALVVPEASVSRTDAIITVPAVALGVPALVAFLVLPLAFWLDARALRAAGVDWPSDPARFPKLAAAVDAVVLVAVYLFFEGFPFVQLPYWYRALPLIAGALAGSWLCVRYLRARRRVVDMPGSLREWRRELRPEDAPR